MEFTQLMTRYVGNEMIIFVLIILFIHGCLIWLWYWKTNNPSVVDVGWATGLTLAGLIYLFHSAPTTRNIVLGSALLIWGLRLAGYLWYTRIRCKIVDKRYITLSENWKISKPLGYFLNFQLQGALIFIISIPWYFISMKQQAELSWQDILGLTVFIIAIILESASDYQLSQFKLKNPGRVCNQKLWRYSRHPNYFFEWCIWCSFAFIALSLPYTWISLISPLTLYLIMVYITAPLTERGSLASRGAEYLQYQAITPMFFPFGRLKNMHK